MRFWEIAFFFIALNAVGGIITTFLYDEGIFMETVTFDAPSSDDVAELEGALNLTSPDTVSGESVLNEALGWFYTMVRDAIMAIFSPLERYLFFPAMMMDVLFPGLPPGLGFGISVAILAIEIVGILQLITGRSFKDVD